MRKIIFLSIIIMFALVGCQNNESDNDSDVEKGEANDYSVLLKEETIEKFLSVDFSSYTIINIEYLSYYNSDEDFEYLELAEIDNDFMMNLEQMSNQFNDFDFSYGGLLSIIVGEKPELIIHMEDGTESIDVIFYRGYNSGDLYRSVLFLYESNNQVYSMGYYGAFETEVQNIYNLINP